MRSAGRCMLTTVLKCELTRKTGAGQMGFRVAGGYGVPYNIFINVTQEKSI